MNNKKKPIVLAVIMAFTLQSCATLPGSGSSKNTDASQSSSTEDPCGSHNKRNTFAVLAGLVGAVIGAKVANNKGKSGVGGAVIGGAIGATVFGLIGNELDKRECELSKIGKQNGLKIETTPIKSEIKVVQQNNASTNKTEQADVGLSVSVVDQDSKPQFLTGSDKLQPYAQQHFQEIAKLYTVEHVLKNAETQKPEEIEALKKAMASKRILLIGHTDDTGDTNFNAKLSESRARAVAQIFEKAGISSGQLYYQGAGETMPMADNATEQGRAKNRRVEIVDLTDEDSFDLYLQNKRPNTQYYRPVIAQEQKSTPTVENKSKEEVKVTTKEDKPEVRQETKIVKRTQSILKPKTNTGFIDFGGKPLSSMNYVADIGNLKQETSSFSLITEARASDITKVASCELDRPRNTGLVKSLKTGKEYTTREYVTGLYSSSWHGYANEHLLALTHVSVLRDGILPANKPHLLIYENYKKGNINAKPNYSSYPEVNVYQGDKALLYRAFSNGPVKCLDIVIPNNSPNNAPESLIVYNNQDDLYAKSFDPKKLQSK